MFKHLFKITFIASLFLIILGTAGLPPATALAAEPPDKRETIQEPDPAYLAAIQNTMAMVTNEQAQALATQYGLNIVNVTWEDTGRYNNSSVGPNISDMTIQVQQPNPASDGYNLALMPVIRYPNFEDLTGDVSPDHFYLLVGNETGQSLQRITLTEYLGNFRRYLNNPDSWAGQESSLLAERDSSVLVSAQAAFLPVPQQGQAEFNPVLFNYQSYQGDPAVLVIVATREGTSATIIDNTRDAFPSGFSWGQRLFFNQNGQRAGFTGERLSDFETQAQPGQEVSVEAGDESGLNMVLLIQVPLKQKQPLTYGDELLDGTVMTAAEAAPTQKSDVEAAVIGHGPIEGPFTEIDNLAIERDERFPIRVTVQFYQATSNGVVSPADMEIIASQLKRVYSDAEYVGSLVVDGPSQRVTEYDGPKEEPADWWETFWQRFESNTGLSRQQARDLLQSLGACARNCP
ncbi:MAG: hypothetical protein BroJett011_17120 [Chloroflexota bacterium]|nr:MAG: hypothetical protein BroJett011_17120 [Chloroflexota bacterium]